MDGLEISPADVLGAAARWDEQHVSLLGARTQVNDAPVRGFTPAVAAAARSCCDAWAGLIAGSAHTCYQEAARLRAVLAGCVHADEQAHRLFRSPW